MVALKLSGFGGERPLLLPRLLPDTAGTAAVNVRMNDGALTPINISLLAGEAGASSHQTIYYYQGDWISWSGVVNAVPGPVASDRLYYTGDGAPKMRIGATVYGLKIARPSGDLTGTLVGVGAGDIQSRTYVYTWVTSYGEESEPSPAGNIVDWKPGQTVTVSGFAATPGGRSITLQRIYRSQTGRSGTYLYLIAERAATNADFNDNIAVDALQEPLPSADWNEPPDALAGLIAMPNGMMAAFSGRDVYFCEPYRPHAWPEKYVMTCDSDVVGLGAVGNVLIVMTKAHPYIMSGSHPASMQALKLETNAPCLTARGIVDLGYAIVYPSTEGLIVARADGSISLATADLLSREDWLLLSPSTIIGAQIAGDYVLFYDNLDAAGNKVFGALFIRINATPFLVRSSERASAVYYDVPTGALYFKRTGQKSIMRLDSPDGEPSTLYWRSKEFWLTTPDTMGVLLVDLGAPRSAQDQANIEAEIARIMAENAALFATGALLGDINDHEINLYAIGGDAMQDVPTEAADGKLSVSVYADGKLVRTINTGGTIHRLPGGFKARKWELAVSSNIQVAQLILAKTMDELKKVI